MVLALSDASPGSRLGTAPKTMRIRLTKSQSWLLWRIQTLPFLTTSARSKQIRGPSSMEATPASTPYPHTTSVILPGSRLTRNDLKWLHDSGWSAFLRKHVAAGGSILGLCGGYQMLGWSVDDPHDVEGLSGSRQGLGLLPIRTKIALPELKVVSPRL